MQAIKVRERLWKTVPCKRSPRNLDEETIQMGIPPPFWRGVSLSSQILVVVQRLPLPRIEQECNACR